MKNLLLFLSLSSIQLAFAQSDGQQLQETFMQEFDPQGYAYYQYNAGIKQQGQQIAQSIASQLDRLSTLNQTNDPQLLINDFNNKMNNIDQLEVALEQQTTNLLNNQASQLGNQLNSGDYMGAFANVMGSLEAYSSAKEQQKKLEQQRAELERQKKAQMDDIWRKKYTYTVQVISQLRQQAAFAESKTEEEYYLKSIDYVWCSYYSSYCDQPQKPMGSGIENKFIAKDAVYRQTADRKLQLSYDQQNKQFMIQNQAFYISEGSDYFMDGAIAFAAKAAQENPSASNYIYLAELQSSRSNILGFTSIMVAESIDPNAISGTNRALYNQLKSGATKEIDQALKDNNTSYLDAFLKGGLDKIIRFNGKSLLVHAISIDNPDAVQLILNHYIEGLDQNQINEKVQKAIMLCAVQDSPNTLKRFKELGVSTDFKMGNHSPVSLAQKTNSTKVLSILGQQNRSSNSTQNSSGSPSLILAMAESNPDAAVRRMEELNDNQLEIVLENLIGNLNTDFTSWKVIGNSQRAIDFIKSNHKLSEQTMEQFKRSITEETIIGGVKTPLAQNYIRNELIVFDEVPIYGELFQGDSPLEDESLAYVAFYKGDLGLFKALDEKFDFSKVTNRSGIPLYNSMKSSGKSMVLYSSVDFGLSIEEQIDDHVKNNTQLPSYAFNTVLFQSQFNQDLKSWRSSNGGTMLHECVRLALKHKKASVLYNVTNLVYTSDKTIRDNDGMRAYDLLKENEDILKDLLCIHIYGKVSKKNMKYIDPQFSDFLNALE